MIRKYLILIVCSLLSVVAFAAPVTKEQARQIASQFLTAKGGAHRAPAQLVEQAPVLNAVDKAGNPYIYAFNAGHDGGYVLVSGDDRFCDVLGYGETGSFDNNDMPDNMRAWLQGYVDEMKWTSANPVIAQLPKKRAVKNAVEPLLKSKWNQNSPYNNLCPEYTPGVKSATGCVATAMAQAMYYYKWPEEATTLIPSYEWVNGETTLGPLNPVVFNWAKMLDVYSQNDYDDTQANAVATLMQYCGYGAKMNYWQASSSNSTKAAAALRTYFNYNNTTQCVERSSYSYENWIEIIYHEVSGGRPVIYGGQSSGGGHEFVCDGYEGEDFFHINWGWGGKSDGYFKLSLLNPYEQGIGGSSTKDGFHYWQDAIIGLQKPGDEGEVLTPPVSNDIWLTTNSVTIDRNNISLGESVTITIEVANNNSDNYDADLFIFDDNTKSIVGGKVFFIKSGETKDCAITFTPKKKGSYSLYGLDSRFYSLNDNPISLVVGGSSIVTTDDVELSINGVTVENLDKIGTQDVFYGKKFKGYLSIDNETEKNYSGTFQLDLYDVDAGYELKGRTNSTITVLAGGSLIIPIEGDDLTYGHKYRMMWCYVNNGAWTSWSGTAFIMAKPGIMNYASDGTFTVTAATEAYNVPAGVLSVDLTETGVTSITPNGEPNCLYFLGGSDEIPTGATNVVKYNNSKNVYEATSKISLTDDNDFYSPVNFTAEEVEFSYNFTVAADGSNGWNTIVLPFDVTSVTADGTEIDWFHSSEDKGKNFWVKEFVGDDVNTVNFYYANEMKANVPYIVAFPGKKWGDKWDMSNKTLKFIGEDVTVSHSDVVSSVTGSNYRFIGSTQNTSSENIYQMNDKGNSFDLNTGSATSTPFRAYIKPGMFDRTVTRLAIGSGTGTTDIQTLDVERGKTNDRTIYNMNGQRVAQPTKGLYIVNGKKVVIK